ncbi:beta-propeller fold lactonase family protein [Chroococcidiopsis sp. FACHB-1243]|uniref:beta-propeller fold lactonase family protein n=1 Tax=Chroococcidiopsis sp. [FACHB-1243] TaxID=2692781 RepID=UPI001781A03C|nr:beta-propeller fold lactonase family protein [Chroococcidiopsis sp. [FACHB-1243]]MBD2308238.1 beta-propeller fold lactonase family protein [Chroococcidiopsis sp. [FACHB-1243]]
MKRKVWAIACIMLLAIGLFTKAGIAQERSNSEQTTTSAFTGQIFPSYFQFKGSYLAVLSDADMVASAYIDNSLGARSPQMRDELSLIPLANGLRELKPSRLPVSNAVTAWPSNLAISQNGRFAYVTETDRSPPLRATQRTQLQPGQNINAIDLSNPTSPRIVQTVQIRGRTQAATLSPDGRLLAVSVSRNENEHIYIYQIQSNGQLSQPSILKFPGATEAPLHIEFSPRGNFLAGTFAMQNEARFARYQVTGNNVKLEAWGEPLITGKFPAVGHWTPDGSHFIVTNLYWFGGTADLYVGVGNSTLAVIDFNDTADRAGKVAHTIVSTAPVGASAEEFAISPDGRRVVSLNMENSFLPPKDPRLTYYSSLTLLDFDRQTGILTPRGSYPFEGILPEGITFDASGQFLAVANFAHFNPQRSVEQTTIDFWRVVDGIEPKLVQLDVKIPVMRGAHVVKLIP